MIKLPVELLPGEKIIDTWVLLYIPPGGEKYQGICTVTNQRIFCDTKGVLITSPALPGALYYDTGSGSCLVLPKNRIRKIHAISTQLEKRVIIILENDQEHEFNYGTLNIDKIVDAMTTR